MTPSQAVLERNFRRKTYGAALTPEDDFGRIYDAHFRAVLGFLARRTDVHSAADLTTETFLVAWRRLDDVPEEPSTRPWLLGVARRLLANDQRGMKRRDRLTNKLAGQLQPAIEDPSATASRSDDERESRLRAALADLDATDRELIFLSVWEGLTAGQIAEMIGIAPGAARTRLHRARRRLKSQLDTTWPANPHPKVTGNDD